MALYLNILNQQIYEDKNIMKLFEITNGYMGCCYVRVYALAIDKTEALRMAKESYEKGKYDSKSLGAELLKDNLDGAPFCTKPSDEGWEN